MPSYHYRLHAVRSRTSEELHGEGECCESSFELETRCASRLTSSLSLFQFPMEEFHESPFIIIPASGVVEKQAIVREMALQR